MKIKHTGINLKATLLSGQCFRVILNETNFTIVLRDRVISLKQEGDYIIVNSNLNKGLKNEIKSYLNLDRDYESINKILIKNNPDLINVIQYSKGYKILNQPNLEIIISYIVSQNNTVKNISKCVEKISFLYGKKIFFKGKNYYLFPTLKKLSFLNEEDFKKCGVGFRAKYIVNAINSINNEEDYLNKINKLSTNEALEKLMQIKGIGLKVASCILLFGYGRLDTFPIDTWVKKYLNINNENKIREYAQKHYKEYSGLIIQYLFHYSRNKSVL